MGAERGPGCWMQAWGLGQAAPTRGSGNCRGEKHPNLVTQLATAGSQQKCEESVCLTPQDAFSRRYQNTLWTVHSFRQHHTEVHSLRFMRSLVRDLRTVQTRPSVANGWLQVHLNPQVLLHQSFSNFVFCFARDLGLTVALSRLAVKS